MCFGVAVGSFIGIMKNNIGVWIPMGLSIGMSIGMLIGLLIKKDNNKKEN